MNIQSISSLLILLASLAYTGSCSAIPLVEFTSTPSSNQFIKPTNTHFLYYTLRNNTQTTFPLNYSFTSSRAHLASFGNSCGTSIAGKHSCSFVVEYQAGISDQTEELAVFVNYQGRAPVSHVVSFQVDSNNACTLLNQASYQTEFCQQQYQNVIQYTPNVFNPSNVNVINEQTPGGMFGIYQKVNGTEYICYVSCGVKTLEGAAPDPYTIFELASITKTFTTSILGKLEEKGTIADVNAPITNTAVPAGLALNANESSVSFQQLATFSGGICFSDAPGVNQTPPINQATNQTDFISDINAVNPDPASGLCSNGQPNVKQVYTAPPYLPTHNFYSNSSVGLLGQALMSIDGYVNHLEPEFNRWMCGNIINVLEMERTNACLPNEALNGNCAAQAGVTADCSYTANWTTSEYASGYHLNQSSFQLGDPFPFLPWAPAGGIRSNTVDMVKYVRANLGIQIVNTLEEQELIAGMQRAQLGNNYLPVPMGESAILNTGSQFPLSGPQGYAWVCMNSSLNGNLLCGKIGGHKNFRSFIGLNKTKNYGVIILFNSGAQHPDGQFGQLSTPPTPSVIGVNLLEHV